MIHYIYVRPKLTNSQLYFPHGTKPKGVTRNRKHRSAAAKPAACQT